MKESQSALLAKVGADDNVIRKFQHACTPESVVVKIDWIPVDKHAQLLATSSLLLAGIPIQCSLSCPASQRVAPIHTSRQRPIPTHTGP